MRVDWDTYFMMLAHTASDRATCLKKRVGAIIVDPHNRVISTGYNGSEPGKPHCIDVGCLIVDGKCKRTIHAEDNAIRYAPRWKRRSSKMYCTHFPCFNCAKCISNAGIIEIIYDDPPSTPRYDVLALLEEEGIVSRQFKYDGL